MPTTTNMVNQGSKTVLLACLSVSIFQLCVGFVIPRALHGVALRPSQYHHAAASQLHTSNRRPAVSALRMMAKKAGGGSKRRKKKAAAVESPLGGATGVSDAVSSPTGGGGFEDAGAPMMAGGGAGFVDVKRAKRGEVLEEGMVGTDDAREAKIEETLRKMGVQSIGDVRAERAKEEGASVGQKITSIFDLIPAEVQLALERVFIAGFVVGLLFLVACGSAIGVEAYFLSTEGKLPPDLDNFVVQTLEPLFTPSLGLTFLFSSCLGVLKLGQMGQESVVYREDD